MIRSFYCSSTISKYTVPGSGTRMILEFPVSRYITGEETGVSEGKHPVEKQFVDR